MALGPAGRAWSAKTGPPARGVLADAPVRQLRPVCSAQLDVGTHADAMRDRRRGRNDPRIGTAVSWAGPPLAVADAQCRRCFESIGHLLSMAHTLPWHSAHERAGSIPSAPRNTTFGGPSARRAC